MQTHTLKAKLFIAIAALLSIVNVGYAQIIPNCGNKIAIYFNQPVDNSVSTGVNAAYLNNSFADTIVAYINRAKYSIDIAQYDYNQSGSYTSIATAINNAYLSGKKVRWIYDSSQVNTGLALLNPGIHTMGSPTTAAYGIMHHKFIVIDANSANPNDAIVSTGSEDWGVTQFNLAPNNLLFLQDSALAHAYLNQFNMMWGDTGVIPNTTTSKYGPFKTDLGQHIFHIDGKLIELYFSPSDATNTHILSTINSANTDLYFGVFTFTVAADANAIVARQTAGVYTAGIVDQNSNTSAAYPILTSGLGTNLKTYVGSGALVYHNKMLIVDPSNACSDPAVLTGSHNWSTSANTKNDENTLIIHNDTVANVYYQSFKANFAALGGTLTTIAPCATTTCAIPSGLYTTSVTSTAALLNWSPVSGAVSYAVQYRVVGASVWDTLTVFTDSVSITTLTPTTNYEFQVATRCASGSSAYAGSSTFTTLAAPCSTPSGLNTLATSTTSATIGWTPISGSAVYYINYRPSGTTPWSATTSSMNSVTIAGLLSGTVYEYEVAADCSGTPGTYSTMDSFATTSASCAIPTTPTTSYITNTSAILGWTAVGSAAGYIVNYRVLSTATWTIDTVYTNTDTLTALTAGTLYEFRVSTLCIGITSAYTGSSIFSTLSSTCPVPVALTAASVSSTAAQLTWSPISGAVSYNIRYRKAGTTTWQNTVSAVASVIINSLSPSTFYEFQVQARCTAPDTSGYAGSVTFKTSATAGILSASLEQNTFTIDPNPTANGNIHLAFQLNAQDAVSIVVYDIMGREVQTLINNEIKQPGNLNYAIALDAPGVYLIKLTVGQTSVVKRAVRL